MRRSNYTFFIRETLEVASAVASTYFGRVSTVETKAGDSNQVLTEADTAIGRLLVEAVRRHYPDDNVIDEEAGVIDGGSPYTWVTDPIDGTSNFAVGLPAYAIMIGLLDGGTPVAGGIALPAYGQIFTAERGGGSFCNGHPVSVSQENDLGRSLVAYGIDGYRNQPAVTLDECAQLANIVLAIRNLRTSNSAYDLAMVACGKYGAFLNRTSKIWDNVAPHVIIEEAGGVYTDVGGHPMDYTNPLARVDHNFTVLAAPAVLHKKLLEVGQRSDSESCG